MKIPETILIGGVLYTIENFDSDNRTDQAMGRCDPKLNKIHLCTDLTKMGREKTFIHEVLHAIIEEYGIDIPEDHNENMVSQLTTGVYDLIERLKYSGMEGCEVEGKK